MTDALRRRDLSLEGFLQLKAAFGQSLQAGQEVRAPLPFASLIRDRLLTALARGRDSWDWSGLASVAREDAGLPPRRT